MSDLKKVRAGSEVRPVNEKHDERGCLICSSPLVDLRVTDVPRVLRCQTCGAPYMTAGLRGVGGSWDGPFTMISEEWIQPTKRLWEALGINVAPGFGFADGSQKDGRDVEHLRARILAWLRKNAKGLPPSYASWGRTEDKRFV